MGPGWTEGTWPQVRDTGMSGTAWATALPASDPEVFDSVLWPKGMYHLSHTSGCTCGLDEALLGGWGAEEEKKSLSQERLTREDEVGLNKTISAISVPPVPGTRSVQRRVHERRMWTEAVRAGFLKEVGIGL